MVLFFFFPFLAHSDGNTRDCIKLFCMMCMYYAFKIEYQDVQGCSMTDSFSMLYSIAGKGIHSAGLRKWMGLQSLIKKTLTFLNINLIHMFSPPSSSDFPLLEWIRRELVYLDRSGKELNIHLSQENPCSTNRVKVLKIMVWIVALILW